MPDWKPDWISRLKKKIIKPSAAAERLLNLLFTTKTDKVFWYSTAIILFTEIRLKYS